MQKGDNSNFKEELIHLHDEFFTYLRKNSCKGVPLKVRISPPSNS